MAINLNSLLLQDALNSLISRLRMVKSQVENTIAQIDSGANADQVIGIMRNLQASAEIINSAKSVPGLLQYAKDQFGESALDIVADVNATLNSMSGTVTWITNNFPKDANGFLLKDIIVNGATVPRTFTAAQMVGLKAQLNSILANFA